MNLHPSLTEWMAALATGISIVTWFRSEFTRVLTQERQLMVESGTVIKSLCDSFAVIRSAPLTMQIVGSEQLRSLFMGQFLAAQGEVRRLRSEAECWPGKRFYTRFLAFYESWVEVGTIPLRGQPLALDAEKWSESLAPLSERGARTSH